MHLSSRGIPLLFQTSCNVPVITLENYCKWYSLYVVYPDGRVVALSSDDAFGEQSRNEVLWGDHNFHPKALHYAADYVKGTVDEMALEAATGRWVLEDHPFDINDYNKFLMNRANKES